MKVRSKECKCCW